MSATPPRPVWETLTMKTDDASALDRDEFDGEDAALFDTGATDAEAVDTAATPDTRPEAEPELDEDLLEADLGECDVLILDDEPDDVDLIIPEDEEGDEDEVEMAFLQEMGIDLDSADDGLLLDAAGGGFHDDDPLDDGVAA
jgi:hypothetical protein